MFQIEWKENAIGDLNKFENSIVRRMIKRVDELSNDPFSKDIKRLKSSEYFRLRVGDYRIIFSIEGNLITILKVGHRKNIYDR